MATDEQKEALERAIARARNGMGERIDELDRHVRDNFDPKTIARSYAPQLIAGGAVAGVVVGFVLPKLLRKLLTVGVPIALVAYTVKKSRDAQQKQLIGLS